MQNVYIIIHSIEEGRALLEHLEELGSYRWSSGSLPTQYNPFKDCISYCLYISTFQGLNWSSVDVAGLGADEYYGRMGAKRVEVSDILKPNLFLIE